MFLCSLHPFSKHPGPSTRFSAPYSLPSFSLHLCFCSLYPCPMHPFPCNLVLCTLFSEPLFHFSTTLVLCTLFPGPLFHFLYTHISAPCSLHCSLSLQSRSLYHVPQHPVTCTVGLSFVAPFLVICSLHSVSKMLVLGRFLKIHLTPSRKKLTWIQPSIKPELCCGQKRRNRVHCS